MVRDLRTENVFTLAMHDVPLLCACLRCGHRDALEVIDLRRQHGIDEMTSLLRISAG